ncbi:hypothetical protein P153DRAFT_380855 [Dothidotthia symphoricarpi CBS 119687]|uniref:Uncharacterized protein n=1 Tax=Dothidotthia symphoricarpi CBS 119687 TaxID=1392245 RepID=A0A6A6AR25_9PLEO|nr:uncharacterized protein P153DRAFT_380855 [Dothidotthia symphoricarpi CBS 119687]KAF2133663.1 hypothetical protein P153DRAFT_380855 [Dothidotthia symphoricarpi CBS 119687]
MIDNTFLKSLPEIFKVEYANGFNSINNKFYLTNGFSKKKLKLSNEITRVSIVEVLSEEMLNSCEANLNRVMYFGHTWSPVSILHVLGLNDEEHTNELLKAIVDLEHALDQPDLTKDLMLKATASTTATRDGKLRAPLPIGKLGEYRILPNLNGDKLKQA